MKRLVLVDSHAIIHRAFHALPPLTSPGGEPVNAVYGFATILLRMVRELKPDYIAAAFDLSGPTFRHVAYERYKSNRPETPSDLSSQFNKVKELVDAFGIAMFEKEGYEADDIIGTIAKKLKTNKNIEVMVVTGDMDTLQLIRPRLFVYAMKKGVSETMTYGEKEVIERYGITPKQVIDFKGLKGDPSDNIPGVKGIGEKTAALLIQEFGSIENIYKALKKKKHTISPSVAAKLIAGEEAALVSRDLATIETNVPIEFDVERTRYKEGARTTEVITMLQKFGFTSLIRRFSPNGVFQEKSEQKKTAKSLQQGMFGDSQESSQETTAVVATETEWDYFIKKNAGGNIGLLLFSEEPKNNKKSGKKETENNYFYIVSQKEKVVVRLGEGILKSAHVKKFFLEKKDFFTYDAKALIHFLRTFGIELGGVRFDIKLAAYVSGEFSRDFSYIGVASRELGRLVSQDPREEFMHFFDITLSLEKKLNERGLDNVMFTLELPLVRILADMEDRGVMIDSGFLNTLSKEIDGKIKDITKSIYESAGEEFNINSSQQLSRILFEKLGVKTYGLRKTEKGGVISTSASELEKLKEAHPIIEYILQYRELTKLASTYVDVLPHLVDPHTGRLHTTYHQTGTATGRLSSTDPNLQNIPIMSDFGKEVRKAFIAKKGYVLASFDYSQIELRVAASLAKDKKMIDAFRRGVDIHTLTASEVYNIPIEKVTSDLRRAAKTLNFGILYGMGPQSLAESTGMSREDARKFIDEYFSDFSGIENFIKKTKEGAESLGYVETLFGRRRYVPEIYSANWQLKREGERMAVNAPVQGTAADLVKLAMIQTEEWVKKEKHEADILLLLQVHDELVFEIKKEIVDNVTPQIRSIMEHVAKLEVPLVVDVKFGANWGDMTKIK